MSYSVQDAKNDLTGVLHGTQLNQIQNLDGVFNRAARQLLLDVDPQETKRTLEFTTPIYNSVFDYAIADDVKGNKLIDIRPQVRRLPSDIWLQSYNQAFDIAKQNVFSAQDMFTMNFNTGLKTVRINAPYLNNPIIVNQADDTTDNGTWAVGGTGSNLTTNNTNFVVGAGSLQFDSTVGSAYVENSTMTSVNLSSYVNQASLFVWVYMATGSNLTSVELRWGSSSGNYYSLSVTQNQQGNAFVNGWNLCQFDWASASVTGSPDSSAIGYLRVTLVTLGTNTANKVNGITNVLGTVLEYEYYSKYLFRDAITGAFQETVTDDSNLINLDTESYNLLFNLVAFFAAQQQQGKDSSYDGKLFYEQYQGALQKYKNMYKSETQKPMSTFYAMPYKNNYGRFFGRNGY